MGIRGIRYKKVKETTFTTTEILETAKAMDIEVVKAINDNILAMALSTDNQPLIELVSRPREWQLDLMARI